MTSPLLLVAHPSPDLYGSDLQLLEAIDAARGDGWRVHVVLPQDGPLRARLKQHGATVEVREFPVLRKALLTPKGLAGLAASALPTVISLASMIRRHGAHALLVNTVTIPLWEPAGRLAGVPVVTYVHEAEEDQHPVIAAGLAAPMLFSRGVIANSRTAARVVTDAVPLLERRVAVVHNGVPQPPTQPRPLRERGADDPLRLVYVGRLAPRKGTDTAVAALGLLRAQGVEATLDLYGSVYPGYEWFEEQLRAKVAEDGTGEHVRFHGYVATPWDAYDAADVVVMPSRAEPFGNVAIEAMHAGRPVVASAVQGLTETIEDGVTGLHVPADDPAALADAVARLARDPQLAQCIAGRGRESAAARFSLGTYRERIVRLLRTLR